MKRLIACLSFLCVLCTFSNAQMPPPVMSGQPTMPKLTVTAVVDGIQKFYDACFGMEAAFIQEAVIKSMNKTQAARGKVYFKKPGKMAWLYDEPTQQKIISDGLTLWMYLPENGQVIKNRTNQAFQTHTPQNFLSGLGNIKQEFVVTFVPPVYDHEKNVLLKFVPRTPQHTWAEILVTAKPIVYNNETLYQIIQTNILDRFGNMNKMSFFNIRAYTQDQSMSIPETLFTFIPPAGVKVIEPPAVMKPQ